jgi:NAD-dependent dihydropyrimidine dehydrogenase PreA subunit
MSDPRTRGWVEIHAEECKGCALCIAVCPAGCLELSQELNHQGYHPVFYQGDGCRSDGLCFYACPEPGAIEVFRGQREEENHE